MWSRTKRRCLHNYFLVFKYFYYFAYFIEITLIMSKVRLVIVQCKKLHINRNDVYLLYIILYFRSIGYWKSTNDQTALCTRASGCCGGQLVIALTSREEFSSKTLITSQIVPLDPSRMILSEALAFFSMCHYWCTNTFQV